MGIVLPRYHIFRPPGLKQDVVYWENYCFQKINCLSKLFEKFPLFSLNSSSSYIPGSSFNMIDQWNGKEKCKGNHPYVWDLELGYLSAPALLFFYSIIAFFFYSMYFTSLIIIPWITSFIVSSYCFCNLINVRISLPHYFILK